MKMLVKARKKKIKNILQPFVSDIYELNEDLTNNKMFQCSHKIKFTKDLKYKYY
jgi:hypothetical protein